MTKGFLFGNKARKLIFDERWRRKTFIVRKMNYFSVLKWIKSSNTMTSEGERGNVHNRRWSQLCNSSFHSSKVC